MWVNSEFLVATKFFQVSCHFFMIFIQFFKIPWYFQVFQVYSHFSRFSRSNGNPVFWMMIPSLCWAHLFWMGNPPLFFHVIFPWYLLNFSKFHDISRFSRCTLIFPGFPGRVGTLSSEWWYLASVEHTCSEWETHCWALPLFDKQLAKGHTIILTECRVLIRYYHNILAWRLHY